MSVDALMARMAQEAQARIAALRAAADAEVAALAEAGARASSRDVEQALATRQATREAAFAVERAAAQRRAASAVLAARHAFLDRVFARAESLAAAAGTDARYLAALPRQVAAVAGHLADRTATLRCRPELAPHLKALLADRPRFELIVDDTLAAGFIAEAGDGSCTIDATLPARLAAQRPQLDASLLQQAPR